ncbi:MAG: 3-phosphoshikimate 1-carboxyvinyltransferase, partial [Chloroflexota bacterium]|nr:3-phosphoshikimate 1-carboxyvinyltransferase [Chloroflexota bacterium]
SSASYFYAAAAVTGGRVRVQGLGDRSLQGDARFVEVLEQMGCEVGRSGDFTEVSGPRRLRGITVDLNGMPDMAQTLAAIAPFASSPVTITGIAHNRGKETDRIAAVAAELRKLGVQVEEREDGLKIYPSQVEPAEIDTYDDHRMAMSFAVTGLRAPGIKIRHPECVHKTFPEFFRTFQALTGV